MLQSVRPSVCLLSVPFSDSVPFARWRRARVAVSLAFDWGQHGRRFQMLSAGDISLCRAVLVDSHVLEVC